ncbi:MAG: ABC transporter ATP-binding protein/permease [Oscillospiraceae bacterium]|jgi:ATP-binding cassette subfamily B protein|nr:ABC transporter ATP-binding protein/permease [Oscillospiraceae bacterium]
MAKRTAGHGMLSRIFERLTPYRKRIAVGFVLVFFTQLLRMFLPLITREVVNNVIPGRDFGLMLQLGALMLVLTAGRAVLLYSRGMLFERVSQDFVQALRAQIYARLQAQSYTFYDKHRIGEIMSRLTGDMEGVRNFVMTLCLTYMEQTLMFLFALFFMATLNLTITLVMLAVCPALAVIAWLFNKKIRPAHTAVREQNAVLNTRTQENIAGVRVVKAFAREPYESEQFMRDNQNVLQFNLRATRIWANFNPVMDFVGSLAVPLMLLVGGSLVAVGKMDLGTLIAQTGYVWMLVNPMRMLANFVNVFAQGITSAEKLFYYLDLGSIVRDPEKTITPDAYQGRVTFENVSLAYGDHEVLHDLSFDVAPGQTVALMGATGSGKTSIVNLIGRFYDIRSGSVKVDGVDVRQQPLQSLRTHIGYVMQESFLFSDSIAENISFGRPGLAMDKIEESAEIAQAEPFITHMPQVWETIVGERGLGLSGGQKQRVSIARALAIDPTILILDDSTSAVDMETEAEIQQGLKQVLGGRTTFIIAHRISSVIHADQILVLEDGTIKERGTHAALMEKQGLYYEMFMDQYRDFANMGDLKGA